MEANTVTRLVGCVFSAFLLGVSLAAAAAGDTELDGSVEQGGLVVGRTVPGSRVEHDGSRVRVSADGWFVIGFHRDAAPVSRLRVRYPDGTEEDRKLAVAQREYQIQRIDGLPPSKVTPSAEDLKRIRTETALVKKARTLDDARTDFLSGFIWPVAGRISGVYGSQRILNGEPRRPHYGIDIAAPAGTPVHAPADGVITLVHPDMFFSGGTLIVDHGHGVSSSFLHLKTIRVKEGQRVRRGDVIAQVGSTGRSTGAHLDWRINLFGKRLDPQIVAGPMPDREESETATSKGS